MKNKKNMTEFRTAKKANKKKEKQKEKSAVPLESKGNKIRTILIYTEGSYCRKS
jgi:hypothetical protein